MKLSPLIFLFFIGIISNAQNYTPATTSEKPIVIINNTVLADINFLNTYSSKDLNKLDVVKDKPLSSKYLFIEDQHKNSLIKAEIIGDFKTKSQKELNIFFGLKETNDIYVNGYLLEDKSRQILTKSIKKIELIEADKVRLKTSILNITI
ncbi:hypothetical protein [Mesonia aquimarina]|uniref:hypothetical protein n=1 Tax=Mesonia aquimarina TaxID=1504967 RepID=UPI000EF57321|nr:hypothetical protein [Mesonia aquimarina]